MRCQLNHFLKNKVMRKYLHQRSRIIHNHRYLWDEESSAKKLSRRSSGSRVDASSIGSNDSGYWNCSPLIPVFNSFFPVIATFVPYIEINIFPYTRENGHFPWKIKSTSQSSWILWLPCLSIINLCLYYIQTKLCYFNCTELLISGYLEEARCGPPHSNIQQCITLREMTDIILRDTKFPMEYRIPSRDTIRVQSLIHAMPPRRRDRQGTSWPK